MKTELGGLQKFVFGESDDRRYSLAESSPASQPSPRPPLPVAAGGSTPPNGKVTPRQHQLQQQTQHIIELQTALNAAFTKIRLLEQRSDPSTHLDYKIFRRKTAATLSLRGEQAALSVHFLLWKLWLTYKKTDTQVRPMPALRQKQETEPPADDITNGEGTPSVRADVEPSLATSLQPLVLSGCGQLGVVSENKQRQSIGSRYTKGSPSAVEEMLTTTTTTDSPPSTLRRVPLRSPNPLQVHPPHTLSHIERHQSAFCHLRNSEETNLPTAITTTPPSVDAKDTYPLRTPNNNTAVYRSGSGKQVNIAIALAGGDGMSVSPNESLRISEDSPPRSSLLLSHRVGQEEIIPAKSEGQTPVAAAIPVEHPSSTDTVPKDDSYLSFDMNTFHTPSRESILRAIDDEFLGGNRSQPKGLTLTSTSESASVDHSAPSISVAADDLRGGPVLSYLSQPVAIKAPQTSLTADASATSECSDKDIAVQTHVVGGGDPSDELVADLRSRPVGEVSSLLSFYRIPVDPTHSDSIWLLATAMTVPTDTAMDTPDEYVTPNWSTSTTPASDHITPPIPPDQDLSLSA